MIITTIISIQTYIVWVSNDNNTFLASFLSIAISILVIYGMFQVGQNLEIQLLRDVREKLFKYLADWWYARSENLEVYFDFSSHRCKKCGREFSDIISYQYEGRCKLCYYSWREVTRTCAAFWSLMIFALVGAARYLYWESSLGWIFVFLSLMAFWGFTSGFLMDLLSAPILSQAKNTWNYCFKGKM